MTDKKFTVFHIDTEKGLRGGEIQLLFLAGYLKGKGHQNIIVCRAGTPLAAEAERLDFPQIHFPLITEWDPISAWRLRGKARSSENPIFHTHTSHGAALAFMAAEGAGIPRVVHRRVDFSVRPGVGTLFKYKRADRVIAVSEAIRQILIKAGIPAKTIVKIHDAFVHSPKAASDKAQEREALRLKYFQTLGIPQTSMWIGNVAALVPHKDHETLLNAMPGVFKEWPETFLLIAGDGPLMGRLKAQAESLGIHKRTRFLGYVRHEVAMELMQCFDLFVLSSWGEGMGSVLLEAMACRIPIVATRAGGIPEVLTHRHSALLAYERNPELLRKYILELIGNPQLAETLAKNASTRLPEFEIQNIGSQIERLYGEIS